MDAGKSLTTDFRRKKKKAWSALCANSHGVRTLNGRSQAAHMASLSIELERKQAK